jgi:hypothetical protein
MMMMLNYSAYAPFNKLMNTLEEKGFMPKGSKPTVCKVGDSIQHAAEEDLSTPELAVWQVVVEYIIKPTRDLCVNLFTRPPSQNFNDYVSGEEDTVCVSGGQGQTRE